MTTGSPLAVVFDLDGLLVDSEPVQIAAWEAFLAELGHSLDRALLAEMFGLRIWDSARLVVERLVLDLTVDAVVQRRDELFFASLPGRLIAMPGAIEIVAELRGRGVPLALATSGHRRYVDVALDEIGLAGAFDVEVTGDAVARGKPAPDIYLSAAKRLGVEPGACVALEDAPLGVASAKSAGMRCLAVPNSMTAGLPGLEAADAVLESLSDVVPWLVSVGSLAEVASRDSSQTSHSDG
ncbi:MAG TPA: HAD family phosphatase [Thermomicrobiaceae bacterium]|nr:HAD family phosphatase [Thermomicrobiaceae bacterium]